MTTVVAPQGYDWKEITSFIMKTHNIEISGGLGPSVGLVNLFFLNMHFCTEIVRYIRYITWLI